MKNSRTVELHISAHDDDDVTEPKKKSIIEQM